MNKIPKLRFKEFIGNWESKKLGTMGEFFKGSTLSKAHLSKNGNPCILYGELYTRYGEVISNVISKTNLEDSKLVIGQKNDVLIPSSGESAIDIATASCLQQDNVILGGDLNVFRSRELNGIFASYQLNNSKRHEIAKLAQGASVVHVYNTQLSKLKLSVPSNEEQVKIASFFSLIDDKISLQGEKVEALKNYKRGMMQKIFSRELRFKDDGGRDYPEWEEKKLNEVGDTYTGLSGKTKENFGIGEAKYVIYKNVFGNTLAKAEEVDLVEINEGENQNKVVKGDLLFTTSSETPEEVGMISCWNYDIEDLYLNSFCFGYRLFDLEQCSPIFMAYLLRSEDYRRKISILGQGSTRYNISKTELMKMKVSVPNIEEQRKIVSLLLGLERNIEKNQEKLHSLKEYKKGLLQQMFI